MNFGFVPAPFGPVLRGKVEALLDRAVVRGGYDWCEVWEDLNFGLAQLWLTTDGQPINATVTRRDGDTLEVWLCGGSVLCGALPFLETILAAAKVDGSTNARIIGRKGWSRVLRPYGWRSEGETLVKELAHG